MMHLCQVNLKNNNKYTTDFDGQSLDQFAQLKCQPAVGILLLSVILLLKLTD